MLAADYLDNDSPFMQEPWTTIGTSPIISTRVSVPDPRGGAKGAHAPPKRPQGILCPQKKVNF